MASLGSAGGTTPPLFESRSGAEILVTSAQNLTPLTLAANRDGTATSFDFELFRQGYHNLWCLDSQHKSGARGHGRIRALSNPRPKTPMGVSI